MHGACIHTYISFSIFSGGRLRHFDVLLNNLSVDAAKNNRGNKLCMFHRNKVRQGVTEKLRCKKSIKARYVKIQIRGTGVLTLCEVEVYVKKAKAQKGKGNYAFAIKYIIS